MEQRTALNNIDVAADGTVGVRLRCEIVMGDTVLVSHWHRTTIAPGVDHVEQMAAVNRHLGSGLYLSGADAVVPFPPLADDAIREIGQHVALAHTPERVARYKARVAD